MRKLCGAIPYILLVSLFVLAAGCTPGNGPTSTPASSPTAGTGIPAKLAFITQPSEIAAGSSLGQPTVAIQDSSGNTVTSAIAAVRITITPGTGASGAVLFGPSTVNAVNGVVKFNNLSINKAGAGYTLTAASGNLASAVSASFEVTPGAPARLAFSVQPSGGTAGSPLNRQPEVVVQDHYGNNVSSYDGSVTLAVTTGSGRSGATVLGTSTIKVTGNAAKFTDISVDKSTVIGYTFTAMSNSLEPAVSQPLVITAGAPVKLEFTVQPSGAKAGTPFEEQPKVAIEDKYGNVATASKAPVTVAITPGTGTSGAVLSGTTTLDATGAFGGLADFTDLAIDKTGTGYKLTATSEGLTPVTSEAFDVAAP